VKIHRKLEADISALSGHRGCQLGCCQQAGESPQRAAEAVTNRLKPICFRQPAEFPRLASGSGPNRDVAPSEGKEWQTQGAQAVHSPLLQEPLNVANIDRGTPM